MHKFDVEIIVSTLLLQTEDRESTHFQYEL